MRADAVLQVRIDSNLKKEAEMLFERLGISLADAVRMFVSQCIEQQGLPFEKSAACLWNSPEVCGSFKNPIGGRCLGKGRDGELC